MHHGLHPGLAKLLHSLRDYRSSLRWVCFGLGCCRGMMFTFNTNPEHVLIRSFLSHKMCRHSVTLDRSCCSHNRLKAMCMRFVRVMGANEEARHLVRFRCSRRFPMRSNLMRMTKSRSAKRTTVRFQFPTRFLKASICERDPSQKDPQRSDQTCSRRDSLQASSNSTRRPHTDMGRRERRWAHMGDQK